MEVSGIWMLKIEKKIEQQHNVIAIRVSGSRNLDLPVALPPCPYRLVLGCLLDAVGAAVQDLPNEAVPCPLRHGHSFGPSP